MNAETMKPGCSETLNGLDAYRSNALAPDAANRIHEHLEICQDCALELDRRHSLSTRLKSAVATTPVPLYLETRIRARLNEQAAPRFWRQPLMAVGAALLLSVGVGVAYQLGHLRLTTASQESYIAGVTRQVSTLMRVGLGDHIHCSVFRKYPKEAPKLEDAAQGLGREFQGLVPLVRQHFPEDYRLMLAHECRYHGRPFVHLIMKRDTKLVSLVIARKREGESFAVEGLVPALAQSGIPFYRAGAQRFEIASFESRDHLVYLISDLPKGRNLDMMAALAPDVRSYLQKLEI